MSAELASLFSEAAARKLTDQIRDKAEETFRLLAKAYNGLAHVALGYNTWREYVEAEFGMTDRNARFLLVQASVTGAIEQAARAELPPGIVTPKAAAALAPVVDEVVADVAAAVKGKHATSRPAIAAEVVAAHVPPPAQEAPKRKSLPPDPPPPATEAPKRANFDTQPPDVVTTCPTCAKLDGDLLARLDKRAADVKKDRAAWLRAAVESALKSVEAPKTPRPTTAREAQTAKPEQPTTSTRWAKPADSTGRQRQGEGVCEHGVNRAAGRTCLPCIREANAS